MEFSHDENGQEILLKDGRFQVMMEWEKPYMEACIKALAPKGDVLEVGFGCGYASSTIQSYQPKSHTIIEYHPIVASKARAWSKNHSDVTIIENTWQDALPSLGMFDTIFFDDYPLESEQEMLEMQQTQKHAQGALLKGQKKMEELEHTISILKNIKYTDQDINFFFTHMDQNHSAEETHFLRFFFDLEDKKNISQEQLETIIQRLHREKKVTTATLTKFLDTRQEETEQREFHFRAPGDRLFNFLESCLKDHMRKGARFSCYLNDPTSKFEDEKFFKKIITNPYLEYKELIIPIKVPSNCNYYKGDKALVITVTKI